jgi:hypothetical protein
MICPRCTFENPPALAFCGRCGAKLAALCPSCGFANPEGFGMWCSPRSRVVSRRWLPVWRLIRYPRSARAFARSSPETSRGSLKRG